MEKEPIDLEKIIQPLKGRELFPESNQRARDFLENLENPELLVYPHKVYRKSISTIQQAGRAAAERAMEVMGYVVTVKDGWVIKEYKDGWVEKIEKLEE